MKALVVGSGGREHAVVWKLAADPAVQQIYAAPGNPGISAFARCFPGLNGASPHQLLQLATELAVDLTVVGPEAPLVAGVVDVFRAAGRLIVGPTQANARLEGSKIYAKQFFAEANIPTAVSRSSHSYAEASAFVESHPYPLVIKADGLAAGKGVIIAHDWNEALAAIQTLGPDLVIEEFLSGEEVSFIVLSDGRHALTLEPCQDHKAAFDHDQGPNTGGMGAYCDSRILTDQQRVTILNRIIQPAISRTGFTGFLYAGLMMTADGPKLLEFNVRLGDPETQPILHRMVADFGQVLHAAARGSLESHSVTWRPEPSVCVVMASAGYPESARTGDAIFGIDQAEALGATVFQAGTQNGASGLETAGGRVLGITSRGSTLPDALHNVYGAVDKIHFPGAHFRTDIGSKGVFRWPSARYNESYTGT